DVIIKASNNGQRKLRAFGEMVALLWAEGKGEAALQLEQLWNQLSRQYSFSLFCAYPMQGFGLASHSDAFDHICQAHSHVLPTENSIQSHKTDDEYLRSMAVLEQKARSFDTEVARNKESGNRSRLLAAIVESSDDAIISKDLNGIIMSWNAGAERIFGYTPEEIVGKSVLTLIPPERQQEEPGILARLRSGLRIDHYETVRRRKDGSDVDVSLTVSPVRDETGKIVGASKIARDITERKHAELQQQALYEVTSTVNRAASLPEIYEAAIDAICRCQYTHRAAILLQDANGVMRFKAWRDLSDVYRQAVEGHSPWQPDEPAPQPVCIENIDRASLDEQLRSVVKREGIRSLAFLPIIYEGRLLGKFMIYYDIPHRFTPEELRLAQTIVIQVAFAIERRRSGENLERMVNERTASLREAIAQMEEFSYSVSHDLRAPVRAMQCYAEVLMEDYGQRLDEPAKKYLERIIGGGARMDRLIQDILTYSRLSRREIQSQPIDLDKLTREIVRQYQDMISSTHADISVEGHLHDVIGHEASLSQAISNLISNAVKFVAPGAQPKVRIRTDQRNGHVRLWVEDNGIGIKPEYQHRLFSVFERVHPEKNYEGTGIGLAIVRKATERMGGKAGVESDGVTGSRFWIQLPATSQSS
ncbi:MAG TPA: PAS domain S-box protein, partial [Candidatus Polarisedimenticolia bacterium]|nr:PAS domain S-box protein [Candidatus Polarisedimenticolia bacterium]